MALIALKCPNCNGDIQLDDKNEFGFCMYCGCKVMLESAISGSISIDHSSELSNVLVLAKREAEAKHWDKTEQYVERALIISPDCSDAWYIKALLAKRDNNMSEFNRCIEIAQNIAAPSVGIISYDDIKNCWGLTLRINNPDKVLSMKEVGVTVDQNTNFVLKKGQYRDVPVNKGHHEVVISWTVRNSKTGVDSEYSNDFDLNVESDCSFDIKVGMTKLKLAPSETN